MKDRGCPHTLRPLSKVSAMPTGAGFDFHD